MTPTRADRAHLWALAGMLKGALVDQNGTARIKINCSAQTRDEMHDALMRVAGPKKRPRGEAKNIAKLVLESNPGLRPAEAARRAFEMLHREPMHDEIESVAREISRKSR